MLKPMARWARAGFIAAGIALHIPDEIAEWATWTDGAGILVGGLLVVREMADARRLRLSSAVART